jgi:hypothetical protein
MNGRASELSSYRLGDHEELSKNGFYIIVRDSKDHPISAMVVDPWTWGWVGLQIANGLLSGAGSKVFADLFATKQDLQQLLADAVRQLEIFIKRLLDERDKRVIDADTGWLQSQYRTYVTGGNKGLLLPLQMAAGRVAAQALALGIPTVPSFAVVGGLELTIMQEIHKQSGHNGDRQAMVERAQELCKQATTTFPARLREYNDSRFIGPGGMEYDCREFRCYYWLDGDWVQANSFPMDSVPPIRDKRRTEEYSRLDHTILGPLWVTVEKWAQIK